VLNYLGNHSDSDEIEAITKMSLSHDKNYVATISYDNWIKFHNISAFVEARANLTAQDFDPEDDDVDEEAKFDDEVEDWGDSDIEDFGETKQRIMKKKTNIKERKREIEKEKKINFFSDLTE